MKFGRGAVAVLAQANLHGKCDRPFETALTTVHRVANLYDNYLQYHGDSLHTQPASVIPLVC